MWKQHTHPEVRAPGLSLIESELTGSLFTSLMERRRPQSEKFHCCTHKHVIKIQTRLCSSSLITQHAMKMILKQEALIERVYPSKDKVQGVSWISLIRLCDQ